ncbi:MAG: hypothetical protein HGA37_10320, partial [Lentimicrobium sp.]|nr:hypothetical protein [Lentimicrobium sp.]
MHPDETYNQLRQAEITGNSGQQPLGEDASPTEEPGEVRMSDLNQEVEKKIEVGLGVKSSTKTSPTPPKEGLSAVEDNNPEKTCRHGKPGYITANECSYPFIKDIRDTLK